VYSNCFYLAYYYDIINKINKGEAMEKGLVIKNKEKLEYIRPKDPTAKGSMLAKVIGEDEGWDDYVMRVIKLEPGGKSFNHNHEWPHINYYIRGKGLLTLDGEDHEVVEGEFSYVPENSTHQWKNDSKEDFEFICIVPKEGHNI